MPTEKEPVGSGIADPGPLGLAAFALTTFLLSAKNAGWTHGTDAWLGYAFFYGGAVQLLAGMWEFRNRNTFGATAFSTYGAFWLGLGFYAKFVAPAAKPDQIANDEGWILLAFAIVNLYLLIASTRLNTALFAVFLTLQATEVVLFIGAFATNDSITKIGGYIGVLTAVVAWYTSFAIVFNSVSGREVLKLGRPLVAPGT
ncbi:hypothetical protein Athai_11130 [Actinocatenispora thailandica]|uniref:Uncharacterized protein n=1 Tax=Actinocatenispora thailandica TaxID=227318 RepID=A0A7R7DKW8_9ACTN|nr:acetate uptake transporter [Actinocatenispora thailandica]BCJ33610.1 hypothetical protein Athai_11130 [Actinocatenispora thailandica]